MDKEEGLTQRTRNYLASTLPLDTGKSIKFLREQGTSLGSELTVPKESPSNVLSITGEEAKTFYESVLSMPQKSQLKRLSDSERKQRPRSKRKHSRAKAKVQDKLPTIGQLFRFAQDGDTDSLKQALDSGHFDVNITDNFNWTLLMSAAYAGHKDTVEYLLSVGAQWRSIVDSTGQNAADLAQSTGHAHIAELIESYNEQGPTSEECSHSTTDESHSKTNGEWNRDGKVQSFFCDICQLSISQDIPHKHKTSTLHQFNCQHHPSPHAVYGIPQSNRGYQLLLKKGWDPEAGLGSEQQGQQFPVKTVLKRDRLGFGIKGNEKARVTHFEPGDTAAIKRPSEGRESKQPKKKDILRAAVKDKQWEHKMRQYMSTDHNF